MDNVLKKLISFKTVTGNHAENRKLLLWFKNQIKGLPLSVRDFRINKFPSLVITTRKKKNPILWLQAHTDVVPGPSGMFRAKIKGNRIYGRGAYDMKFALACYLEILKQLGNGLGNYDFGIMLTSDEEVGGSNGVKALLGKGFFSKVCFLPDGGEPWTFEEKAKGVWHLRITASGRSAHGSRPWLGKNAVEEMVDFLHLLKKKFPHDKTDIKNHYHETINIGVIEGGERANLVPSSCSALVDIRFTDKQNKRNLKKRLDNAKKEFEGIKIEELVFGSSYGIKKNNKYVRAFSKEAAKLNIKTSFSVSHGSSDARFFAAKGIPALLIKPKGGGHHSEKEWVDSKDLRKYCRVLKEFVIKIAKP